MDETVFDPFMVSGTSAIAAIKSHRKFLGTEIDEDTFELSKKRLNEIQR